MTWTIHEFPRNQALSQAKTPFPLTGSFCADFPAPFGRVAAATRTEKPCLQLQTLPNQITGARRMSLTMLVVRDEADGFTGLPRGTAKPFEFLAAFQEAEPYLGLPPTPSSWCRGWSSRPSRRTGRKAAARLPGRRPGDEAEYLGLSPARVKALNRALYEAGVFVIRDNEQGKRYGRRGADGRIIEAYGFDLSPLALRHDEFIRLAAEAKVERERMKALRKRVTLARRGVRQAGETLAGLGPCPRAGPACKPRRPSWWPLPGGRSARGAGPPCPGPGTAQSRGRAVG